jgi:hypothetical protein
MDLEPGWEPFRIEGDLAVKLFEYITQQNAGIIEVPPTSDTEPLPLPNTTTLAVTTKWGGGQNVRAKPSMKGTVTSSIGYGQTAYIARDDAVSVGVEDSWVSVTVNNTTGWAASWLLKVK